MQLTRVVLVLLLFAVLFAIITQRFLLSADGQDNELALAPLKKQLTSMKNTFSELQENFVGNIGATGNYLNHTMEAMLHHEGLVDWVHGLRRGNISALMTTTIESSPPYTYTNTDINSGEEKAADPSGLELIASGGEDEDLDATSGLMDTSVGMGKGKRGRHAGGRGRGGRSRGGRGRGGRGKGRVGGESSTNLIDVQDEPRAKQSTLPTTVPTVLPISAFVAPHTKSESSNVDLFAVNVKDVHTSPRAKALGDPTFVSPRKGTDITAANQLSLLRCPNQSKCIVPELQLDSKLRVYMCRHPVRQGVRFYFLVREGLLLHPNVELLPFQDISSADFVVYLPGSAPWHRTECNDTLLAPKLIVLDEFDGHNHFVPFSDPKDMIKAGYKPHPDDKTEFFWYYMYFKRSYVVRKKGVFQYFPHLTRPDFYPITYSLAEAYLRPKFNFKREMEIVCTLRGSKTQPARQRVQTWVEEYAKDRKVERAIVGQINSDSRTTVSKKYFDLMHNAQIIVTVNPSDWEGDFRLWESMATGALIFVDPIFAPHPFPLIHGEHLILFSNTNKTDLWNKLDYYRANPLEARKIAINGYLHAMKHHRTVSMIDYVMRSAHTKRMIQFGEKIPNYIYPAQYLFRETMIQKNEIVKHQSPGVFYPVPYKPVTNTHQHFAS